MCGIVGYIGSKPAVSILVEGLRKLEYRGYDSAGVAVLNGNDIEIAKSVGKLNALENMLKDVPLHGTMGIGHTRWATHGKPSDVNSHPHTDCSGKFAVVHNGIIENYRELRQWLQKRGHTFVSETDTEVLPHLVEEFYDGDLLATVGRVVEKVEGSYAVVVLAQDDPHRLVAARKDSPLVVGLGDREYYFASDIPAILCYTRETYILNDGEIAELTRRGVRVMDARGNPVEKEIYCVNWDAEAAEKCGYPHFMIKEIYEQPTALRKTLSGRLGNDGQVTLEGVNLTPEEIKNFKKIFIVACGTAYHAGMVGKHIIEKLSRIDVEVDIASEFRYRQPLVDPDTLTVLISQSGETADTLAALREARKRGSKILAITNVVGSSISREAENLIYTWAGPEIAVASTKAYVTQLLALYMLGLYLAQARGTVDAATAGEIVVGLKDLPKNAEEVLGQAPAVEHLAKKVSTWDDAFFIGRGLDHAVAMEGALKLKEISYIHAEAYAAGELKHGTLALIEEGIPVLALVTQEELFDKMLSNIQEVKARGGDVTMVTFDGSQETISQETESVNATGDILIPRSLPLLAPVLAVIPLQLLAYYAAVARNCDVDKPRNLAKSVTVE
ncbi:MAG: glutamine--fructose-6-phosphate transaminase (isomerizing) [Bacillota bacterium]